MLDRSSAPAVVANRTDEAAVQPLAALRRLRFSARAGGSARPTGVDDLGVKKLGRITGGAGKRITGGSGRNPRRQRTDAAGVRRNTGGREAVHVAIDDATRLAYVEVLADEKATIEIAFLRRAVAFFKRHGMTVQRLMTDNGSPYRPTIHPLACRALGNRHLRTRPYRPKNANGKAERFSRTLLAGWA